MEIYSDAVVGLVLRVIECDDIKIEKEIIDQIEKIRIFDYHDFNLWYKDNHRRFSKICYYLELIDYMRLLLLEYIRDDI
jgi:hypothetical protein